MRNWIAGAMTILGSLLVIGGAVTVILRAWWKPATEAAEAPVTAAEPAPVSAASTVGTDLFGTTTLPSPYAVSAPPAEPHPVSAPPSTAEPTRGPRPFGRFDAPERLIAWGIVLLVLAAVAAGAISFDLASAPVR
ncbi:hypothetical protein GCM10023322_21830 [Rugosimonospora acidiphila]|uniref:Uncharacterized protein n=1 Tax=Rugosimonospora acidiphila TaxID=556531 RepID=A0ABP9RQH5_9ACTN